MLDGAALGTLMIGLESVRQESEWSEPTDRHSARRSRAKHAAIRVRLSIALRSAADRLDRPTTQASLGSPGSTA